MSTTWLTLLGFVMLTLQCLIVWQCNLIEERLKRLELGRGR